MAQRYRNQYAPASAGGAVRNISPKTMAMVVLLAVMALLWGRVLFRGKGGPAVASAGELSTPLNQNAGIPAEKPLRIKPVSLPILEGRHDGLTQNMFSAQNWTAFDLNGQNTAGTQVAAVQSDGQSREAVLKRITAQLRLEAVIRDADGSFHQAFINDKILTAGATLTVQEGPDQYVLTVSEIREKQVTLTWEDSSVVLKMTESFEF